MAKDDIQAMLRAIINGQSAFRQEVLKRFDEVDQKFEIISKDIRSLKRELTERMDKLGKQLAYLEDDAPLKTFFTV